ncbi:low specificity L-threonine aldolase [Tyzzerella sp. OttesenSCG-928-J15]|nr:low specificity L-threonine aldolase [Tyzzerella sp. OttesenSCG-928-J15]
MIRFECDYGEGGHPKILEKLMETNFEQTPGYGLDDYCQSAAKKIKAACGSDAYHVHFFTGGTQANLTVIASLLRPYEGVISADTGHINTHETGAIEATGHKVITVKTADGKLSAKQVEDVYNDHWNDPTHEHIPCPGMVYISHPTENGTTYKKAELEALSQMCRKLNLPLFMDGARLGYGLAAYDNDLSLADIASLCDLFYIGGTKVGAMFGEALVITQDSYNKNFRYYIKQRGALLAKGRMLGIQFDTLFTDGLYLEISKNAIDLAMMIKEACVKKGYKFLYESSTNQQFPILPNEHMEKLAENYAFSGWGKVDENHTAVRFCTSWATKKENVEALIRDIEKL